MKKVKLADRASVRHLAAMETELFRDLLPIIEHLALLQYEDGSPRQGGFLMLWTEGSSWRVLLKDKDAGAKLPLVGRTVDEVLGLLALHLGADDCPWEPDSTARQGGATKGKK